MRTKLWRFLEILPGATTWLSLILPVVASFFWPAGVATFVLVFDLYWLYKSLVIGFHLVLGYRNLKKSLRTDWLKRLQGVRPTTLIKDWRGIYQAIILTTYKEELATLESSIQAILESTFPLKKTIFILATEERDKTNARLLARILKAKYGQKFFHFIVSEHPDGMPGEHKGK